MSPTLNTSSIKSICVSIIAVIEKASLEYIPLEYVLTGLCINLPNSENLIISSIFSLISCSENPKSIPDKNIFSYPVSFGWNPTPIESKDIVFPCRFIVPLSAEKIPAIALSNVDFPLPF